MNQPAIKPSQPEKQSADIKPLLVIGQHLTVSQLLRQAQALKLLRPLDIHFACWLADDQQPALMLAAALVSRDTGDGHVCLPLDQLTAQTIFAGQHQALAQQLLVSAEVSGWQPAHWQRVLLASAVVSGDDNSATPLKLSRQRLYLHRLWHNECTVAHFFSQQNTSIAVDQLGVRKLLDQLFGNATADKQQHGSQQNSIDWQKIAVAVALTRRTAIISGGPGTGKTTTVVQLLRALLQLNPGDKPLRIRLAAPTGKAAARLSESLGIALQRLTSVADSLATDNHFPAGTISSLPVKASTLHHLLGIRQSSQHPHYHADNPLHLDVLVVDEASMIDLSLMARLIEALPGHARLILLGDHDQLASVEAGAILGDICHYAHVTCTNPRATELNCLTGYCLRGCDDAPASELRDSLCLLRQSYRFDQHSGIGQLASAVNNGDEQQLLQVLTTGFAGIRHKALLTDEDYQLMLSDAVQGYQRYLHLLQQFYQQQAASQPFSSQPFSSQHAVQPQHILAAFAEYQHLCALRDGDYGVAGLNTRLENTLLAQGLLRRATGARWYHGRPIMITRNDSSLGLFNGDTGIALQHNGEIRVWFTLTNGDIKAISPARLPAHDTAWCITVHKSQGSEFDHVALILPQQRLSVITRELIYTAITRAKKTLTLYASSAVLCQAIAVRTERHSGLLQRIAEQNK